MNSAIKIIKRGTLAKPNNVPAPAAIKTDQEREHNTASAVKAWDAEWEERKRSLHIWLSPTVSFSGCRTS